MFIEIDGDFDDMAIRTFKVGLPAEHDLRKSLTKKPVRSMCRLMDRIDEYKQVEEDQQQEKGKAKPSRQGDQARLRAQGSASLRPPLGTINVIFAALGRTSSHPSRVISMVRPLVEDPNSKPKRAKVKVRLALSFSDEDKIGTIQPHDDALQLRILVLSTEVVSEEAKCERLEEIVIDGDSEKFFQVGAQLPPWEKEELLAFLRRNIDVFAWNAYEAPGVDLDFICHHLNVNPAVLPKKQPPRRLSKEHFNAVKEEVNKFKQAGAIKEVFYSEWLANTVVVKKRNEKWREKIAFVTLTRNYHYKVMPFSLKNAGSTYQRMMSRMFEPQLGKNIEIYIDDMVVKSKLEFEHINDLENIFKILRKHKLQLNASKCFFGVESRKFLGYMVTHRRIEVNPDQIKAINSLQPPWNPKEIQKLTGMTAALNRFISQSADRCRPFFQLLNKWKGFEWTEECVLAF
ncbi:uncharacterized protein LOC126689007 [Quercus robur]|uniref:uncharacterized protein LOC126689007 n=1 Tax=Quercus robur TaxID=38942 RepID=UPI0021635060|nr:uncharacterized protein LOC126689007 [Quercus robur]